MLRINVQIFTMIKQLYPLEIDFKHSMFLQPTCGRDIPPPIYITVTFEVSYPMFGINEMAMISLLGCSQWNFLYLMDSGLEVFHPQVCDHNITK